MALIDVKKAFDDGIIGLPPSNLHHETDDMIRNSIPIASISPAFPTFTSGQTIFKLDTSSAKNEYIKILKELGFSYEPPINVAFLADNFPTDSFTNEYSESFLNKLTDVVSSGMAEINQFFGSTDARDTVKKIASTMGKQGGVLGSLGGAATTGLEEMSKMGAALGNVSGRAARMVNTMSKLAAGGRIDFPMIWKNSGFQPSYTMTIRLFNPNPASDESTMTYIVGPIAVLLTLGLPRSVDNNTYNWPFLQKVKSPGLYNLNTAFISNITVVKGGDQQQISFRQRVGIVDVRIEFGSLYSSIMIGKETADRPTLKSYLDSMMESKTVTNYDAQFYDYEVGPDGYIIYPGKDSRDSSNISTNTASVRQSQESVDPSASPSSRVSSSSTQAQTTLTAGVSYPGGTVA